MHTTSRLNHIRCLLLLACCLLGACANVPGPRSEHDPWEGFNRSMYAFNDGLDRAILKPAAKTYVAVVPDVARTGVHNFFSNLGDLVVIFNDLLQFKIHQSLQDTSRLIFNSTLGLFGLIDVASHMGLPKHHEDFGQTLATWGVGSGPYLVLPFFGPSTLRDTTGKVPDNYVTPINQIEPESDRYAAIALDVLDIRAGLLEASDLLETAALDPYVYLREAYLQRRLNQIHDGHPPSNFDEDDLLLEDELLDEETPDADQP